MGPLYGTSVTVATVYHKPVFSQASEMKTPSKTQQVSHTTGTFADANCIPKSAPAKADCSPAPIRTDDFKIFS
jgi:hypothetical protein